jgi:hypothetical protein
VLKFPGVAFVELRMPRTGWTPSIVPNAADQTVYLVVDRFGRLGTAYRETDVVRTDLETTITDLMSWQFSDPVRVVAFNTPSDGRRTSQEISPSKSRVAATSTVTTFRKRVGTLSIAAPVLIGSSRCGWRSHD